MDLLARLGEFISQKEERRILQLDQANFTERCKRKFGEEISDILIS
jgi:hypothetical protein